LDHAGAYAITRTEHAQRSGDVISAVDVADIGDAHARTGAMRADADVAAGIKQRVVYKGEIAGLAERLATSANKGRARGLRMGRLHSVCLSFLAGWFGVNVYLVRLNR
jgi:hypothetical protein